MFAIAIWQQGALVTDSTTNIFNITDVKAPPPQPQPSSTRTSSTRKTATTGTATATAGEGSAIKSGTPASVPHSGTVESLSTATKTAGGGEAGSTSATHDGGLGYDPSSSRGLSTSEAIGVGVGATAGVVLLVAFGWYLGRRVARRNNNNHSKLAPSDPSVSNEQEIGSESGRGDGNSGYYLGPNGTYYYYSGTVSHGPPTEMGVDKDPVEALPGSDVQRKVELPASGW